MRTRSAVLRDCCPAALIAVPARPASTILRADLLGGRGTGIAGILHGGWPPDITSHVAADCVLACDDPDLDDTRLFDLTAAVTPPSGRVAGGPAHQHSCMRGRHDPASGLRSAAGWQCSG